MVTDILNKCSDRSLQVKFSALPEIMTDKQINRQTDRPVHREVSLQIKKQNLIRNEVLEGMDNIDASHLKKN